MTSYNRGESEYQITHDLSYDDDSHHHGSDIYESESWMIAYLDLMTLLLALFIVMGALSHTKAGVNLQGHHEAIKESEIAGKPMVKDATVQRQGQNKGLEDALRKVIGSNSLGGVMDIKVQPGFIRLQMDARLLFPVSVAKMKLEGQQALKNVAALFKDNTANIEVEGHSDNVPISGGMYQSNWALSAARAVSVVEALVRMGVPRDKLHASAYADTRPLMSNATAEGRAKNRRVEFIIEMGPEYARERK